MNLHEMTAIVSMTGRWPDRYEQMGTREDRIVAIWDDDKGLPINGALKVVCQMGDKLFEAPLLSGHNNYEYVHIRLKQSLKKKVSEYNDSIENEEN